MAEGAPTGLQPAAAGTASDQASTPAAASLESAVVVAAPGPAAGSTGRAAPPDARAAAPAAVATMGAVAAEPAHEAVADDPVSAPAPVDHPVAEEIRDDPRLLFDRLTDGMVDAVPADRAPRDRPTHARRV